ncbi:TetR/AcrR family transcriptional regulator [Foetidibacter luteolus]|uniref:TetR/AcrR family transcriptional regulator n=1 Tax=Foetidibacter luteolus TaxID=2608880 RepID=UPI00129A5A7D|nr:TetR/AcrR family transcriptional regulator [Foetidibacter luteolus]
MEYKVTFQVNESVYLRNPETSEIGKNLIKQSIDLVYELGFEHFTFKKLATQAGTTEATVYRYFENKHRLLLYIISWYWFYIDFLLDYNLQNITNPGKKLEAVIDLLTHELPEGSGGLDYNKKYLNSIVIAESSKVYLIKEVTEINQHQVFKPYKDLCAKIASIISEYNPAYPFPKSLSSTIIETSHHQQYFSEFLPRLTDADQAGKDEFTSRFISSLVFKVLG